LSEGLVAAAGHSERSPDLEAASAPSGLGPLDDISWNQAIDEIARWTKKERDASFVETDAKGQTVNRCETIAFTGGCTDTNEFNYLVVKTMRSMGLCAWKTRRGFDTAYGLKFGTNFRARAMTNGWIDIKNTDMMLIMAAIRPRTILAASNGRSRPNVTATPRSS